jgi:hypothetical protein
MPHTRQPAARPDAFASLGRVVGNRTLRQALGKVDVVEIVNRGTEDLYNSHSHLAPADSGVEAEISFGERSPLREATPPMVQAKLTVGQSGDEYEREADHVAELVTRISAPIKPQGLAAPRPPSKRVGEPRIQRLCASCNEGNGNGCACAQRKAEPAVSAPAPLPTTTDASAILYGGGKPLSAQDRNFFEPRFGADFSRVRIHSDEPAAELARTFQAQALTVGGHIVFGAGRYAPTSTEGRKLLAHELTHVVQQSGSYGRAPSVQLKGRGPGSCGFLDEAAATVLGTAAHVQIQRVLVTRGFEGRATDSARGEDFELRLAEVPARRRGVRIRRRHAARPDSRSQRDQAVLARELDRSSRSNTLPVARTAIATAPLSHGPVRNAYARCR